MSEKFRISARKVFLTYPQCPITKESAITLLSSHKTAYILVSEELHKDENKIKSF